MPTICDVVIHCIFAFYGEYNVDCVSNISCISCFLRGTKFFYFSILLFIYILLLISYKDNKRGF